MTRYFRKRIADIRTL